MKNARRITQWIRDSEMIPTNVGSVSAEDWCRNETARISSSGQPAEIAWRTHGGCREVCVIRLIRETIRIKKED